MYHEIFKLTLNSLSSEPSPALPAPFNHTLPPRYKVSSSGDVKQVSVISQDLGNTQYESKLLLTDLSLSDKGEFYCKATYSDNTVTESDRVTLFVQGGAKLSFYNS